MYKIPPAFNKLNKPFDLPSQDVEEGYQWLSSHFDSITTENDIYSTLIQLHNFLHYYKSEIDFLLDSPQFIEIFFSA
jgi:hypothetical protein